MARLVLHIGTKKAGSTLIQAFLKQNRKRLPELGWSYPSFTMNRNHAEFALPFEQPANDTHHLYKIGTPELAEAKLHELAEALRAQVTPESQWVISSEYLSTRLRTDEQVEAAVGFLRQFFDQIEVVVVMRRQEFVLPSVYSQYVKDGFISEWSWEFCERERPIIDCELIMQRWGRVVGRDSITAIPFIEENKRDPRWLLEQFAAAAGIPIDSTWRTPSSEHANSSLSAEGIAYLRLFDPYIPRWRPDGSSNIAIRRIAVQRLLELTPGPSFKPDQESLAQIEAAYRDSNAELVASMPETQDWEKWLAQSALTARANPVEPELDPNRIVELMVRMTEPDGLNWWATDGPPSVDDSPPTPRKRRGPVGRALGKARATLR